MSIFEKGSDKSLFLAADGNNIFLIKKAINPGPSFECYNYVENDNDQLLALDAAGTSLNTMVVIFTNLIRQTFMITVVTFSDGVVVLSGKVNLQRQIMTQPYFLPPEVLFGKVHQTGKYFIAGSIS